MKHFKLTRRAVATTAFATLMALAAPGFGQTAAAPLRMGVYDSRTVDIQAQPPKDLKGVKP